MSSQSVRRCVSLYVTPGIHEGYHRISRLEADEHGLLMAGDRIRLFARGFRFMINGWSFVSLGGAPSIDDLSAQPDDGDPILDPHWSD